MEVGHLLVEERSVYWWRGCSGDVYWWRRREGYPNEVGVAVEVWKMEYPDLKERGASSGGSGGAGGI